jgi:hypothetical protein
MSYVSDIGMMFILWAVRKFYRCPQLGTFLLLEDIKQKILIAAKRKEEQFPDLIFSYLSAAFFIPKHWLEKIRWDLLFGLFGIVATASVPKTKIPLLRPHKDKGKREVWDYEGRGYAMYLHLLAKTYGWGIDSVSKLNVDLALALIQEIITDEQLDREFLWSMSDRSYIYNAQTKSGKPNPLERPYFMKEEVKPPEKTKIPTSMMPQGIVKYDTLSEEFRPKVIHENPKT